MYGVRSYLSLMAARMASKWSGNTQNLFSMDMSLVEWVLYIGVNTPDWSQRV